MGQAPEFYSLVESRDEDQLNMVLQFLRGRTQCKGMGEGARGENGSAVYLFMRRLDEVRAYVRAEGIKIDDGGVTLGNIYLCERC